MCIYKITTSMRRKPIGKMHTTLGQAKRAALRAAKRIGEHVNIEHWREGRRLTVFPDGEMVAR